MSVVFFFGSGADTCYSSNIKSGAEFTKPLLTNGFVKQRKKILGNEITDVALVYSNSKKIFAQTIYYNEKKAEEVFGDEIVKKCRDYYQGARSDEELNKFFAESRKSLKEDDYNEKYKKFYLEHAQFFDCLDEKFNSLRFPDEKNNNAKRVINAYWTVFFSMLNWLYKIDNDKEYTFEKLLEILDTEYPISVKKNNYYSLIKDNDIDCKIITTNYTLLAEKTTGKEVTYLHGNLKWFEDLDALTIYDTTDADERKKAIDCKNKIPFILIPSGVKPLICKKQIEEFHKFIAQLEDGKTTELCVIGYRFNSEDNHINSVICEWLRAPGHHMTYFDYDNDNEVNFKIFKRCEDCEIKPINMSDTDTLENIEDTDCKISKIYVDNSKYTSDKEKTEKFTKIFEQYVMKFSNKQEKKDA